MPEEAFWAEDENSEHSRRLYMRGDRSRIEKELQARRDFRQRVKSSKIESDHIVNELSEMIDILARQMFALDQPSYQLERTDFSLEVGRSLWRPIFDDDAEILFRMKFS